jgi:hypothetical protein
MFPFSQLNNSPGTNCRSLSNSTDDESCLLNIPLDWRIVELFSIDFSASSNRISHI